MKGRIIKLLKTFVTIKLFFRQIGCRRRTNRNTI